MFSLSFGRFGSASKSHNYSEPMPDLEAAARFFGDVIGSKVRFEVSPFASDDDPAVPV